MIWRLLRPFFGRKPNGASVVPPNWQHATEGTLEYMARRYNFDIVQRDLQGPNKRFPAFKDEFWRELIKRLG